MCFHFLFSFAPALKHLSTLLRLNPDVAGATLVAFGNNAFAIVDAFNDDGGDTEAKFAIWFGKCCH